MSQTIDEKLTEIVRELVSSTVPLEAAMQAFERKYIDVALVKTAHMQRQRMVLNKRAAAQLLGIHRNTLMNKLRGQR